MTYSSSDEDDYAIVIGAKLRQSVMYHCRGFNSLNENNTEDFRKFRTSLLLDEVSNISNIVHTV